MCYQIQMIKKEYFRLRFVLRFKNHSFFFFFFFLFFFFFFLRSYEKNKIKLGQEMYTFMIMIILDLKQKGWTRIQFRSLLYWINVFSLSLPLSVCLSVWLSVSHTYTHIMSTPPSLSLSLSLSLSPWLRNCIAKNVT